MVSLAENRKARFDYEVLEDYEAGIQLEGHEVKSAKTGGMSIAGSFVILRGGDAWLLNASIRPYQPKNVPADYDPTRSRKLLLRREELEELLGRTSQKGLTIVPLEVYTARGKVKVRIALARRRKTADKREVLKRRAAEREMGMP
ncbi:MAG: SsrA-binding protein SmpB [Candidatus Sungbacteria bacterium]|uniref:SsrA-binding protein n=1 Tax=Candidatus Sungiibacteriota bacterium TaxID=2750080 RepID=A0A932YYI5_9BACT|nr:SsrA-binding protein SmpB [Candidatus Sungbacteria bacterium]